MFESLPRNQPEVILEIDVFHTDAESVRFRPPGLWTLLPWRLREMTSISDAVRIRLGVHQRGVAQRKRARLGDVRSRVRFPPPRLRSSASSSAGRAPALQAGGPGFDPLLAH